MWGATAKAIAPKAAQRRLEAARGGAAGPRKHCSRTAHSSLVHETDRADNGRRFAVALLVTAWERQLYLLEVPIPVLPPSGESPPSEKPPVRHAAPPPGHACLPLLRPAQLSASQETETASAEEHGCGL